MKFKSIMALFLSTVLLMAVLTGCGQTAKSPLVSTDVSDGTATADTSASPAATSSLNLKGAYASLDPKTVMMTIDGNDVTWDELFYYINYYVTTLETETGPITDWSAAYSDGVTFKDYVLNSATNIVLQNAAIKAGATQLNVTLTEENKTAIQTDWDAQVSAAGGEEAFLTEIQDQYGTKELFTLEKEISLLAEASFASMYGENGSSLSDQEVADYTAEDGYLMAKHILMLTTADDSTSTAMPDSEKEQIKQKLADILDKLNSYTGDDFDAYFDELMNANSEDAGGLASFPQGYLFQSGDMVSQFEEGTKALEIGKVSEIIETDYGYHIIYRIPINYDITPMVYSNYGTYSLRYITALTMFQSIVDTWVNSLNVTQSDQYKSLDFSKIFAVG